MTVPFQAARGAVDWSGERTRHAAYDALVVRGSGWAPAVEGWGDAVARRHESRVGADGVPTRR